MKPLRTRFTVLRMMILVAVSAVSMPLLIVLYKYAKFMYDNPFSASVAWVENSPRQLKFARAIRPRQPLPIHYKYAVSFDKSVPRGLPYQVILEVQLIDEKTRVIEETQRMTRYVLAGNEETHGAYSCKLQPKHAGEYRVRYEGFSTDLLGRKSKSPAIDTDYFKVE